MCYKENKTNVTITITITIIRDVIAVVFRGFSNILILLVPGAKKYVFFGTLLFIKVGWSLPSAC